MANGKSVCPLITQQVAKIHMSNHIYSESACLGESFKTVYELQYSIFFTWEVFIVFFADFLYHQKFLNTSHVKNIEANVKQNGLKPSLKHTDSEYIWFDICIFATCWVISGQTDFPFAIYSIDCRMSIWTLEI